MDKVAAASQTSTPSDCLRTLVLKQTEVLEEMKKANETLEGLHRTAKRAETRQSLTSGEGTDTWRLTNACGRGHAATWSNHHRGCALELLYNSGVPESLGYPYIYHGKDTRRSHYLAAVFWRTYCERSGEVYDVHAEHGQNSRELLKLLPAYREELTQAARRKDIELGTELADKLPRGPYLKRIQLVLGDVPEGLLSLYEYLLPVGENLQSYEIPVEHHQFVTQSAQTLPKKVAEYFTWAENSSLVKVEGNPRVAHTEAIVAWCVCVSRVSKGAQGLLEAAHSAKIDQIDEEAETQKYNAEAAILQSLLEREFPAYHKVLADWETLTAKIASEGAEGPTGESPCSSDGERKRKYQKLQPTENDN